MKKRLALLLLTMLLIASAGAILVSFIKPVPASKSVQSDGKINIVTTMYPVYMAGLNIADHIENIDVKSLTRLNTGCLHDYQLTTQDMKLISSADILIINGGGIEGFMKAIKENYPNLTIIDASKGITMLSNNADQYISEELAQGEKPEKYNPHVWLDPDLYMKQIDNIKEGILQYINTSNVLNKADSDKLQKQLESNTQIYINKVKKLDSNINQLKKVSEDQNKNNQAVIFHDSFAYLATRVGLAIAYTVPLDSDTSLSAGNIAAIIHDVKANHINYLFTEKQYSDSIAKQIAAESQAKVYIIDSVVTGDGGKDSYLKAMEHNIEVLKQALSETN